MPLDKAKNRKGGGTAPRSGAEAGGGAAPGPPVTGYFVAFRRFMVRFQWWVFFAAVVAWTALFAYNKKRFSRVFFDQLWWIGFLLMGMVIAGLSYADRDTTALSPYAMLNKNGERMVGQMSVDDMLGVRTGPSSVPGGGSGGSTPAPRAAGVDHDLFHLLQTERFNRNDPCPCGSGKKFKVCCFTIQQNLKSSSQAEPDLYE